MISTLLGSEVFSRLLEVYQYTKDKNCLFAVKRLIKLSIKGAMQDLLEARLKSIGLVGKLVRAVLTAAKLNGRVEASMIVTLEILVYLIENSTEWFLKDLFLNDVSRPATIEDLNSILRIVSELEENSETLLLTSLVYQIFQAMTEIQDIAHMILTKSYFQHVLDPPASREAKMGGERRENHLIYMDKMMILINLVQYYQDIRDVTDMSLTKSPYEIVSEFEDKVRDFFSWERFRIFKEQLAKQNKMKFVEELARSRQEMIEEVKSKKGKKQKKEIQKNYRTEWLEKLENDKHVFVVLTRLYEPVIQYNIGDRNQRLRY